MAATAPERRAPAPVERTRRPRHAGHTGVVRLPTGAVGRTAGAVGGLVDSGVVVGLSRTRMWIGLLAVLLGGIVALNVWGLSLSASTNGIAAEIDALESNNGVLRARVARNESFSRVQKAASDAGFGVPEPRAIRTRAKSDADATKAASRLKSGEIGPLVGTEPALDSATDPAPIEGVDSAPAETALAPEAAAPVGGLAP